MNGRYEKKLRKFMRKQYGTVKQDPAAFKEWVNQLPLKDRLKLAWKIIRHAL